MRLAAGAVAPSPSLAAYGPSDRLVWLALSGLGLVMIPGLHQQAIWIGGLPQMMLIIAAILLLRAGYVARRPASRPVHILLETTAALLAYTAIIGPISYVCARNANPLWDATFEAADHALGYDWDAWAKFERTSQLLATVLPAVYASLIPQTVAILAIAPFIGDGTRGFTMIRVSIISVLVACLGSYVLPAGMRGSPDVMANIHWLALRGDAPFAIPLAQLEGVIAFPSFHASLAVIFLYSMRGLGWLTVVFAVLNGLMLLSTPTYGYHYFSDVLAGIAVAAASILAVRWLNHLSPPVPASSECLSGRVHPAVDSGRRLPRSAHAAPQ